MNCPNCGEAMKTISYDNQSILHCANCGGSFFEENGINRITLGSAGKLASDKESTIVMGLNKYCPRDAGILSPITNDEAVPLDVTLLRCESCHGIFAYPDDLLDFKKAQNAKLDYFKLWNKPLPSIRSVLLMGMLLLAAFTGITGISLLRKPTVSQSQAADIIQRLSITSSGRYLLISFKTATKVKSQIELYKFTTGERVTKIISSSPSTSHIVTTTDIDPKENIYYQILLSDDNGFVIKTGYKRLEIK